jgi:hypothetical protein
MKGLCHGTANTTQTRLQYVHTSTWAATRASAPRPYWLYTIFVVWHSKDCCHVGAHHLVEGVMKEKSYSWPSPSNSVAPDLRNGPNSHAGLFIGRKAAIQ